MAKVIVKGFIRSFFYVLLKNSSGRSVRIPNGLTIASTFEVPDLILDAFVFILRSLNERNVRYLLSSITPRVLTAAASERLGTMR